MKYNRRQNVTAGSLPCLFSISAVVQLFCTCVVVLWTPKDKIFYTCLNLDLCVVPLHFCSLFGYLSYPGFYHKHFILAISLKKKWEELFCSTDFTFSRGSFQSKDQTRISCTAGEFFSSEPPRGNGYPLQYSCLEISKDRGAWWAIGHRVTNSWTEFK